MIMQPSNAPDCCSRHADPRPLVPRRAPISMNSGQFPPFEYLFQRNNIDDELESELSCKGVAVWVGPTWVVPHWVVPHIGWSHNVGGSHIDPHGIAGAGVHHLRTVRSSTFKVISNFNIRAEYSEKCLLSN